MIYLYKSHSLHILAEKLAGQMSQEKISDPFEPVTLVVPNRDTARWLTLQLAKKTGLVANFRFLLPSEWLWNRIRGQIPALPDKLASDMDAMKWALVDELQKKETSEKIPLIGRYLAAQPAEQQETAQVRLAGSIASVFDAYLFYRPEMPASWQNHPPQKGDAAWQAWLWNKLARRWKQLHMEGGFSHNKAELFQECLVSADSGLPHNHPLYVFNPGLLPAPVLTFLKKYGAHSEIRIYQVQPSQKMQKNENRLFTALAPEAVRIDALLDAISDENHLLFAPKPSAKTVLGSIQSGIIEGTIPDKKDTGNPDTSVQIRSCHSALREIEVLHNFLLNRFEEDDSLNPEDVLVVTPNPEQYAPYVRSVFSVQDKNLPDIPFHIGNTNSYGVYERAFADLLGIADTRLEKKDVLNLFRNGAVCSAYHVSASDCDMIEEWFTENHVLRGTANNSRDTDEEEPFPGSWEKALERGWLGQLLGNTDPLAGEPLVYGNIYDSSRQDIWASFASFFRKLNTFCNASREKKTLPEWCIWIQHQLADLFTPDFLPAPESENIARAIKHTLEYGRLAGASANVSFEQFRAEMAAKIKHTAASGARFTRGVIFSSMVPVRALPFRIVALIGLNDQAFPRKTSSPDFDLIAQDPRPGERNRKEEDRNLFLQSVLSAKDIHYCSYIGQSKVDNEDIPPSVIVQEWADTIVQVTGISKNQLITRESLTGFSEKKYRHTDRPLSEIYEKAAAKIGEKHTRSEGLIRNPLAAGVGHETVVDMQELLAFVKGPVEFFFKERFQVGLSDFYREDEEFVLSGLNYHLLFNHVLEWKTSGVGDGQITALLKESGSVPAGWPGERKVLEMIQSVDAALELLRKNNISPQMHTLQAELAVGDMFITGNVKSWSESHLLDMVSSKSSGKYLLQSWVKHLVLGCMHGEWKSTYSLTGIKSGRPVLHRFKKPDEPEAVLENMLALFHLGKLRPEIWLPDTTSEYILADENRKMARAKGAFEGAGTQFGEREREELKLILGSEPVFSESLVKNRFADWVGIMAKNVEEIK